MQLNLNQIRELYPEIYKVFFNQRKENESLHEYLTNKNIICYCIKCR